MVHICRSHLSRVFESNNHQPKAPSKGDINLKTKVIGFETQYHRDHFFKKKKGHGQRHIFIIHGQRDLKLPSNSGEQRFFVNPPMTFQYTDLVYREATSNQGFQPQHQLPEQSGPAWVSSWAEILDALVQGKVTTSDPQQTQIAWVAMAFLRFWGTPTNMECGSNVSFIQRWQFWV